MYTVGINPHFVSKGNLKITEIDNLLRDDTCVGLRQVDLEIGLRQYVIVEGMCHFAIC